MISFVMPTLFKCPEITSCLITQFERCTHPFEFIIVDNSNSGYESSNPNIRVLSFEENIGVNAAWNLGVKEARYNYVCLINDDIVINVQNFIFNISEFIKSKGDFHLIAPYDTRGSRGFFSTRINLDNEKWWNKNKFMTHKEFGMGCLMLFPKEVWIEIPEDLKIYYGDDILWYSVHNIIGSDKLWWFKGINMIGDFHLSSDGKEQTELLNKESDAFQDFVTTGRIKELSQWQR